jgi:acetyltransferase-like isoleucine patch superfamily enzyme
MLKNMFTTLFTSPSDVFIYAWRRFLLFKLAKNKNITIKGKVYISGRPLIDIRDGCRLFIGENVTLNSSNKGYHLNMHSPVKLFADWPGAEIRIGDNSRLNGVCVHAGRSISIGRNCLIAANCHIIDGSGHDLSFPDVENRVNTSGAFKPVVIEDDVWIGANTMVLPGVTIGRGSVISANSVVNRSVPALVVAGGNPAVVIKDYSEAEKSHV